MIEKKEFKLDDDDFNHIAEISANEKDLVQIVDGQVRYVSMQERAALFWQSIAMKYGFIPLDVETNLPMKSAQFFLATPLDFGPNALVNWCRICNLFSGPDTDSGCDNSHKPGCAWFNKPDKHGSK